MGLILKYRSFVAGLICISLLVFAFNSSLRDEIAFWNQDEYSHGYIIPFLALLLAWHRLAEIKPDMRPSWLGIGCLALAAAMLFTAQLSAFGTLAQYGFIIALTGLSLAFFGRRTTLAIAPGLFYLVFAIPLPHLVQAGLSQKLQLLSSSLGVWPLDALGIPVFQEGNIIDLGGFRLQVVDACSGLRYLFPLMSFGYLMAFLMKDRLWKRIVLFLSTIPITIGMNSLRIALIGITVDLWGSQMAEGFIHGFEGWAIFLVCTVILAGEAWVLMHIGKRGHFRYEYLGLAHGRLFGKRSDIQKPGIAAVILCVFLALSSVTSPLTRRSEIIPFHKPLAMFPQQLGDWRGKPDSLDPAMVRFLHLSDYWMANYTRQQDAPGVNFYIGWYDTQHISSQTHSPSLCIPAGGWQIEDSRTQTIPLTNGASVTLTRLLIRKDEEGQLVYYWFDERGRDITETTSAKWYMLLDSLTMHRTDGALVRLVTRLGKHENADAADQRLVAFLNLVYPEIGAFIPGTTPSQ